MVISLGPSSSVDSAGRRAASESCLPPRILKRATSRPARRPCGVFSQVRGAGVSRVSGTHGAQMSRAQGLAGHLLCAAAHPARGSSRDSAASRSNSSRSLADGLAAMTILTSA